MSVSQGETGTETEIETDTCCICLTDIDVANNPQSVVTLSGCNHAFHGACIAHALQHDRRCPLCRYAPVAVADDGTDETSDDDEDYNLFLQERAAVRHDEVMRRRRLTSVMARVRRGNTPAHINRLADRYRAERQRVLHVNSKLRDAQCAYTECFREYRNDQMEVVRTHRTRVRESRQLVNRVIRERDVVNRRLQHIVDSLVS